jgi:hypothetical protein
MEQWNHRSIDSWRCTRDPTSASTREQATFAAPSTFIHYETYVFLPDFPSSRPTLLSQTETLASLGQADPFQDDMRV